MNIFSDSEEEDNNPFSGTNHLYASGIASVADGEDDFIPKRPIEEETDSNEEEGNVYPEPMVLATSQYNINTTGDTEEEVNEEEEGIKSSAFSDSNSNPTARFEPYVSLTMSMANIGMNGNNVGEEPDICISEAGDYKDPWGKHAIGYVVRFSGKEVIRRYSEFDSFRQALVKLLPTVIIPPIPSKHPLIKYFLSPIAAENDSKIIEKRKRMLSSFLNNCNVIPEIRNQLVFSKFLDPEYSWQNVLKSPPIAILPVSNLLAPPLNPTKPSPLHLLLPVTKSLSRLDPLAHNGSNAELEKKFMHLEGQLKKFKLHLQPSYKLIKQHRLHFHNLGSLFAELGAYYNAFSLQNNVIANENTINAIKTLSNGIEKIGHGFDVNYVCSEILIENLLTSLEEPMSEILQFLEDSQRVITFRKLKQLQYQIIDKTIQKRESRIKNLKEAQFQLKRLQDALQKNAQESPTVAEAIKHLENKTNLHTSKSLTHRTSEPMQYRAEGDDDPSESTTSQFPKPKGRRKLHKKSHSGELEPHLLTENERQEEIQRLYKEIDKLNDCFKLISKDMDEVNTSTLHTLMVLVEYINRKWDFMLKSFTKFLISWLTECLKAWRNARIVVSSIAV